MIPHEGSVSLYIQAQDKERDEPQLPVMTRELMLWTLKTPKKPHETSCCFDHCYTDIKEECDENHVYPRSLSFIVMWWILRISDLPTDNADKCSKPLESSLQVYHCMNNLVPCWHLSTDSRRRTPPVTSTLFNSMELQKTSALTLHGFYFCEMWDESYCCWPQWMALRWTSACLFQWKSISKET